MRTIFFIATAVVGLTNILSVAHSDSQSGPAIIGYLEAYDTPAGWAQAFRRGLHDLGYEENRDIVIEYRSAAGRTEQLPKLAVELVRLNPRVIVASVPVAALAAKDATPKIPIVMANASDPVALGLVASLAYPGGNVTGLATFGPELGGKRLQLLAEIVPGPIRIGVIGNVVRRTAQTNFRELASASAVLRIPLELFEVRRPEEFDSAFEAAAKRVDGVVVLNNPVVRTNREIVVSAAARHKVPAIYYDAELVRAGGLISYGVDIPDLHRRAAIYVDKILKGSKPADLPVEQPTKFELTVNLKTAKALSITIPPSILQRADDVIE